MVIELIGALSLPVWLCVEEILRLRGQQPPHGVEAAAPAAVPTAVARPARAAGTA